jgi:hypothetical protein
VVSTLQALPDGGCLEARLALGLSRMDDFEVSDIRGQIYLLGGPQVLPGRGCSEARLALGLGRLDDFQVHHKAINCIDIRDL